MFQKNNVKVFSTTENIYMFWTSGRWQYKLMCTRRFITATFEVSKIKRSIKIKQFKYSPGRADWISHRTSLLWNFMLLLKRKEEVHKYGSERWPCGVAIGKKNSSWRAVSIWRAVSVILTLLYNDTNGKHQPYIILVSLFDQVERWGRIHTDLTASAG